MSERSLTDEELVDARIRAEYESEKWQYTIWMRLLDRLDAAEAVCRKLNERGCFGNAVCMDLVAAWRASCGEVTT